MCHAQLNIAAAQLVTERCVDEDVPFCSLPRIGFGLMLPPSDPAKVHVPWPLPCALATATSISLPHA